MALIKSYRINGISHAGVPYTTELDFTEIQCGNRGYFDPVHGIAMNIAEDLVTQWNRTVKMYGNPTVYSIVIPKQEMPDESQSASTANSDIEGTSVEAAFELVKYGQWSLDQFEEWCVSIHAEATKEGYNDGISEAKAMIDSLLQE